MKRFYKLLLISFIGLAILNSCRPSKMTATYLNPEAKPSQQYDKIYVSTIFNMEDGRKTLENEIAHDLRERNIKTTVSHKLFPGPGMEFQEDMQMVYNKISGAGNNGILTVAVIWEESETRYLPSDNVYSPNLINPYYADYWQYYGNAGPITYKPGYYSNTRNYFIEANFYDVESEVLVWSGQTETYSLANLDNLAANVADMIINELEDADLLSTEE